MGEYIKNIIIAGTVCSVFSMLSPSGEEKTGKYIRYIAYFIVVIVIASPLKNISGFVSDIKDTLSAVTETKEIKAEYDGSDIVLEKTAENISKYIMDMCDEKFDIDKSLLRVKVIIDDTDKENVVIDEIQIYISKHIDEYKNSQIENYFRDALSTETYVFGN